MAGVLSRVRRDERGTVLAIFAVGIPTLILFLAMALDVGNWYAHKTTLQTRVDDSVFAAGLEYGYRFPNCTENDTLTDEIRFTAKKYAGVYDKDTPPTHDTLPDAFEPAFNTAVNDETKVEAVVNGTSIDEDNAPADGIPDDDTDGGDPCALHAGDATSPDGGYWTDVKAGERDIVSLLGGFGVPVPVITARARLGLYELNGIFDARPLVVADPKTTQCARAILRIPNSSDITVPLSPDADGITWTADQQFTMPSGNSPEIPVDVVLGDGGCGDTVTYSNVTTLTSFDTGTPPPDVEEVRLAGSGACANGYFVPRPSSSTVPAPPCMVTVSAWVDFTTLAPPPDEPRVTLHFNGTDETLTWNGVNPIVFSPVAVNPGDGAALDVDFTLENPATCPPACLPAQIEFEDTAWVNAGDDTAIGPIQNLSFTVAGNEERRFPEDPAPGATVTGTITLTLRPLRSDQPGDFATVIRAAPQAATNRSSAVTCGDPPATTFSTGCGPCSRSAVAGAL